MKDARKFVPRQITESAEIAAAVAEYMAKHPFSTLGRSMASASGVGFWTPEIFDLEMQQIRIARTF